MKLGFEEAQTAYTSASQAARALTERWVKDWVYCPNCGSPNVSQFPANSPVADFFCPACKEEYELKAQKNKFSNKVLDGAFQAKCNRLAARNNPSLLLLNYNLSELCVTNLLIVPKHFFVRDIIQKRNPLGPKARRAGWIGSYILLDQVPASGKIHIIRNGILQPKKRVLAEWQKTLFLRDESLEVRGWLIEVMKCVESIGRNEFTLDDIYTFEAQLGRLYPNNRHVRQKIRQQLQRLRDRGYLDFVSRGYYRLRVQD